MKIKSKIAGMSAVQGANSVVVVEDNARQGAIPFIVNNEFAFEMQTALNKRRNVGNDTVNVRMFDILGMFIKTFTIDQCHHGIYTGTLVYDSIDVTGAIIEENLSKRVPVDLGLLMSIRSNSYVYIDLDILKNYGMFQENGNQIPNSQIDFNQYLEENDAGTPIRNTSKNDRPKEKTVQDIINELKRDQERAVMQENYEEAARLQNEIEEKQKTA